LQELHINYMDPTLLLPVTVEHTIDERSPLIGHTQQSLTVGVWPTFGVGVRAWARKG